jgi:hypothetical protein
MNNSITAGASIIVALITAVVGPAVIDLIRNRLNKRKETTDDIMVKQMDVDVAVNTQLRILSNQLNCDRVWISQFHNGGHFYTSGVSIKKFSLFHEVVSPGTSIIQHQFQNIPTSFFSRALKEIYQKGDLTVANMDDLSVTSYGLRDTSFETGCKSAFLVSLKNSTGKFHGVLGVEYVKDIHKFTGKEKDLIRDAAIYISGTLSTIHK